MRLNFAFALPCLCLTLTANLMADEPWRTQVLHDRFLTEGAAAGDINADGIVDLIAGPIWYAGPEFQERYRIAEPREFPVSGYSDQFLSHVVDANQDGANDVLVIGFPGEPARLYLNPGTSSLDQSWQMRKVTGAVDNESPAFADIIPGGLPEIACGRDGQYGFYIAGEDATQPWRWQAVTRGGACPGKFAHGLGVGDVDGDGRLDLLDKTFWWKQPAAATETWTPNRWNEFDHRGGAQIGVADLDDDGDNDIITSLDAHGWGLAWFEQTAPGEFQPHIIMGASSTENDYGIAFSQLHAVRLHDIDGDGRRDIVTGKRWFAHNGKDIGGLQEPVLVWFQNTETSDGIEFIPRQIHGDSGVGVDVLIADMNADNRLDVVSSSKRGLSLHFQTSALLAQTDTSHADAPLKWNLTQGRDQSQYADGYEPLEAAMNLQVPEGFSVDMIAAEPDVTQPIAMCFDARGRIWVVEGHTYPTRAPVGEGRDRIVILSDEDTNGSFETRKVFIEGINLASGIEVGFGGVWVGAAPEFLFIPDADHDDVPDGEPQVLLDGWGYQDTHETLNSFTWGPDGWLYGCHGVFTHSNVGLPGTPDNARTPINAGVWRYHPTRHEFEVFAHGTSNPWGVDFNEQGDWFITACVIPHLYHVIQGARYQRQAGRHFNPDTYDDIKTIADHAHYSGSIGDHAFWGDNRQAKRPAPIGTSILGGGHAHCGLAIYNGGVFPKTYHDGLLFHNLHGHRVVREQLDRNGSGYVGRHRPDFALSQDHQQIGVGVMVGPDGAIYTSDWHDIQTCHNVSPEVWNRTDGRLFRIRYGDVQPQRFDLWAESNEQLIERLSSDNGFFARQAQRVLHERAFANVADLDAVVTNLRKRFSETTRQRDRLRLLWPLHVVGGIDHALLSQLIKDNDEYVRGWAVHFAGESYRNQTSTDAFDFSNVKLRDSSAIVRRYYASILQRLPSEQRWLILQMLASYAIDQRDPNIPLLVWYGLEPLVEEDPQRALALAETSGWPELLRFTIRRSTTTPAGRDRLVAMLADAKQAPNRLLILEELDAALKSRGGVAMPDAWPNAYANLSNASPAPVQRLAQNVAIQFGDASVFPVLRSQLSDPARSREQRLAALATLRTAGDPLLADHLLTLLDDVSVSQQVVTALASFDHPGIADELLQRFDRFDSLTQSAALSTLASRSSSAERLVAAMESKEIAATNVPAFVIRQAVSLGDDSLTRRLENVWGRIGQTDDDKKSLYTKYRAILKPDAIASASAPRGRVLYEANCGKCHKLFGVGGEIGPDITGANRTSVDYWLENILEPNALIGKAYQVTNVITINGQLVSGVLVDENENAITLQTVNEAVVVRVDDIDERIESKVSLMPEGQLQPMTDQQVCDLMKYLTGPTQVRAAVAVSGGDWIEAEAVVAKVSAGSVRPQSMAGFTGDWSGNEQIWWTGGKPGDQMLLKFRVPDRQSDTPRIKQIVIHFTTAPDYATVEVQPGELPAKQLDLYTRGVSQYEPVAWDAEGLQPGSEVELKVKIIGANPQAQKSFMVGIDGLEFSRR